MRQIAKIEGDGEVGMEAVHICGSHCLGLCRTAVLVHRDGDDVSPPGLKYGSRMCAAITRLGRATGGTVEVSPPRVVPAWLKSIVSATGVAGAIAMDELGECTRQ